MARLEISAAAIEANLARCLQTLRTHAASPRLIAVLKDNAYGHGAALVAGICRDFGISMCAVKNEREAAELRGVFSDVLILSQPGRFARGGMGIYAINDLDDLRHLRGERVMLKIDSGMGRSGLRAGQIAAAVAAAKAAGCTLLGAFTHFASVAQIAAQQALYAAATREYLAAARAQNMLSAEADALARISSPGSYGAAAGEAVGGYGAGVATSDAAAALSPVSATPVDGANSSERPRKTEATGEVASAESSASAQPAADNSSERPPKTEATGEVCSGENPAEKSTYINRSDLAAAQSCATAAAGAAEINAATTTPRAAAAALSPVSATPVDGANSSERPQKTEAAGEVASAEPPASAQPAAANSSECCENPGAAGEVCSCENPAEKSTYINRSDLAAAQSCATAVAGAAEINAATTPRATPASQLPAPGELADAPGAFFHSAASFGLFAGAAALDGAARVGLALYGYAHPSLRPAGRLIAERISTRELSPGDAVGYDGAFCARAALTASNYDLGYADGLAYYDGSWPLELGGAQVLGKFSMDSLSAASAAPEICIYEDAAVYAAKFGISVYEALVRLAPGVPRVVVR